MEPNLDYSQYEEPQSQDALARLARLGESLKLAEDYVLELEGKLKKAKEQVTELATREIPMLMDEIKLEEFKTQSGFTIQVKENIRASIPKQFEHEAFQWLRDSGNGSLIKRLLTMQFGRGEDEKANQLAQQLQEQGLPVEDKSTVHAQTLSAFAKEKLEAGEEIPLDLLGVFRQRIARIK